MLFSCELDVVTPQQILLRGGFYQNVERRMWMVKKR